MPNIAGFRDFSESLRERYEEIRRAAPEILRAAERSLPPGARPSLDEASSMLQATLDDLGAAAEELRVQNDALFAAHTEMEAQGQFYRELFDLAPAACLVTSPDAQITHANVAATYLLGRPANALVGRLLVGFVDQPERGAFRAALARVLVTSLVEEWPIRLLSRGASAVDCRMRVSARREGGRVHALQWIITEEGDSDADLL